MIRRKVFSRLQHLATKFPVLSVTGPRQTGKSTALKLAFPSYTYISLEDPDIRLLASNDPRGFLAGLGTKAIIDEAQYVPELFSYIQTIVDKTGDSGQFLLSGSQNFLMMKSISQSLAGRTALVRLLPLSRQEVQLTGVDPTLDKLLFTGGYPRIYDKRISPIDFYPNYIQTYVERDVRLLRSITDWSAFIRFVKLCAGRIGQLVNISSLANECGITVPTANAWLSVLETSYVLFQLKPYCRNYNKRLTKSSKLYFYDTGLACSLLGLTSEEQFRTYYMRGELFENWVITEYMKTADANGSTPDLYFWRDSNGNEVDLLIEIDGKTLAIEIKSSETMHSDHFKGLRNWQKVTGSSPELSTVVYRGALNFHTDKGRFLSWKNWPETQ